MKKSVTVLFALALTFLVGCRGDVADNDSDGRVDPNVEMDLGPDNIGDQHFVDADGFDDYDYDLNNYWDEVEFREAYKKEQGFRIPVTDEDSDGNLELKEFSRTTFVIADTDDNSFISEYEWDIAWENMFNEYLEKDQFQSFDMDNDSRLTLQNWQSGINGSGWFETIDKDGDGQVQLEEWLNYLFTRWDYDNDGELTQSELELYLEYYAVSTPEVD